MSRGPSIGDVMHGRVCVHLGPAAASLDINNMSIYHIIKAINPHIWWHMSHTARFIRPYSDRSAMRNIRKGRGSTVKGGLLGVVALGVLASSASGASLSLTGGNPSSGRVLFEERCSGCHSVSENSFGPRLGDVYGRQAGNVAGFQYSRTLQQQRFVWSETSLDAWLTGTSRFLPGTRMNVSIDDQRSRADIIAYLRSHPSDAGE